MPTTMYPLTMFEIATLYHECRGVNARFFELVRALYEPGQPRLALQMFLDSCGFARLTAAQYAEIQRELGDQMPAAKPKPLKKWGRMAEPSRHLLPKPTGRRTIHDTRANWR